MIKAGSLKAGLSLLRIRTAEALQYRMAALAGASIGVFWGLIEITVYTVFYKHAANADGQIPLTLPQMISYIWINQALWAFFTFNIDPGIRQSITDGNVGIELCRPMDLYIHWYAKTAAGSLGGAFWRCVLTVIVSALLPGAYRLSAPASAAGLLLFFCALISAFLLGVSFNMLATAIRLGITWGEGPTNMLILVGIVLTGGCLPLQMWPDALQKVLLLQPFAGLVDIPARLYIGSMPPRDAVWAIALQLGWTAVFVLLGRIILRGRLKGIIIQGG